MISERFAGIFIHPEAVVFLVIIAKIVFAFPFRCTLNAEVVVGIFGQVAVSATRLQNTLRKRNTGRDAALVHLFNSYPFKLIDIT
ncbi:hypothetical protein D3C85_1150590 [compost metagenome]